MWRGKDEAQVCVWDSIVKLDVCASMHTIPAPWSMSLNSSDNKCSPPPHHACDDQITKLQGATKMYVAYIQPLVKKHETKIDNAISEVERSYQTQVRPGTLERSPRCS